MIIKYSDSELDSMARLMRAEAIGEGDEGMLMVGNVIVNRAIANCLDFKNTNSIDEVVYLVKGGFSGINSALFQARSTEHERYLAKRNLNGETLYPATNALWFYAPKRGESCVSSWFNQQNSGRFKNHCFYVPKEGVCTELY